MECEFLLEDRSGALEEAKEEEEEEEEAIAAAKGGFEKAPALPFTMLLLEATCAWSNVNTPLLVRPRCLV